MISAVVQFDGGSRRKMEFAELPRVGDFISLSSNELYLVERVVHCIEPRGIFINAGWHSGRGVSPGALEPTKGA